MSPSVFKFVTRSGCHLCDEARPLVNRAVRRAGGVVEEVIVESDERLLADFALRIPVVLTPEGAVLAEGEIREMVLKSALHEYFRRH